jgi:hypothetical protein
MIGDLQIINSKYTSPSTNTAPVLTQKGDKNTQIYTGVVKNNISNNLVLINQYNKSSIHQEPPIFNTDYYNLFIVDGEDFFNGYFTVPKELALTESISNELRNKYSTLTDNAMCDIKTFPSIFASTNNYFGYTDEDHLAYYGYISDIQILKNDIRIYFQILNHIPQQVLNENHKSIGVDGKKAFNEFDETHWTIKNVNLIEKLKNMGIRILSYT